MAMTYTDKSNLLSKLIDLSLRYVKTNTIVISRKQSKYKFKYQNGSSFNQCIGMFYKK
jgi:hypothetical protein